MNVANELSNAWPPTLVVDTTRLSKAVVFFSFSIFALQSMALLKLSLSTGRHLNSLCMRPARAVCSCIHQISIHVAGRSA